MRNELTSLYVDCFTLWLLVAVITALHGNYFSMLLALFFSLFPLDKAMKSKKYVVKIYEWE